MAHKSAYSVDSAASYYQVPLAGEGSNVNLAGQHTYPGSTGRNGGVTRIAPRRWYQNPWIKYGAPAVLLAVIVAAVAGGVEGSKSSSNSNDSAKAKANGVHDAADASNAAFSTDSELQVA